MSIKEVNFCYCSENKPFKCRYCQAKFMVGAYINTMFEFQQENQAINAGYMLEKGLEDIFSSHKVGNAGKLRLIMELEEQNFQK